MLAHARSVVSISRAGEPASAPDSALGRMRSALEAGKLADAVATAPDLKPEAQKALASWLTQAKARLEAEQSLQSLRGKLAARLGEPAPATTPR